MKKILLAMMLTAVSTFATARTLELLTSSGLSGWNVDKGSWANLHHEASGFDSIWFFPNDPNRESWSTLSLTVNLPDFGIVPGSGLSVSASVVAFSEWNGYPADGADDVQKELWRIVCGVA